MRCFSLPTPHPPPPTVSSSMATTNRPQSRPAPSLKGSGPSRLEAPAPQNGAARVREEVALTFDDVLLVPNHSLTHPRDTNVQSRFTRGIELRVPLVAAAMDTVT